ncbi:YesU family protein [Flavobacteriaceae bacterium GSB9]|nr:YesU family protein [Flavobacteriaceae bacterium GSB9]
MNNVLILLFFLYSTIAFGQDSNFERLHQSETWKLKFDNSNYGSKNWQKHWFLDGKHAKVELNDKGLNFMAGPIERDDACHAVLWTKQSFKGDIKIEYEYTRTDTKQKWVNILYIQATGAKPFNKDIYKWKEKRAIPAMKTYFNHMKLLHISYAAFNNHTGQEYVRARYYPVPKGKSFNTSTDIQPDAFNTGLFKPNITYKITAIKTKKWLYFYVKGENESRLFSWDISNIDSIKEGRIGLRHMFTRSARYKNFKVFSK